MLHVIDIIISIMLSGCVIALLGLIGLTAYEILYKNNQEDE